jgi:hypothetical protein
MSRRGRAPRPPARARGDPHQLALAPRPRASAWRRHSAAARAPAVVEPLEAAPARRRDARSRTTLERSLDRTVPPRPGARRPVLLDHLAGGDRTAVADILQHALDELGSLALDAPHAPTLVRGAVHPPAQERWVETGSSEASWPRTRQAPRGTQAARSELRRVRRCGARAAGSARAESTLTESICSRPDAIEHATRAPTRPATAAGAGVRSPVREGHARAWRPRGALARSAARSGHGRGICSRRRGRRPGATRRDGRCPA